MRAQHLDEVAFLDLKRRRTHRGRRYRFVIKPAMSFDLRLRQWWGWGVWRIALPFTAAETYPGH